jgi:hypothetical protein
MPSSSSEQGANTLASDGSRRWDVYELVEIVCDKALAILQDIQEAYWSALDKKKGIETDIADGRIGLALHVMNELEELKKAVNAEYDRELKASQVSKQRMAA